jgi:hypothetical protein
VYLDLGIQSVQSAPVFSFNGKALGTFVVAFNEPKACSSFDVELMAFGAYGMHLILQKPSCRNSGPAVFTPSFKVLAELDRLIYRH